MSTHDEDRSQAPQPALRLLRWSDPAVIAVALAAMASGFGQFGVVAALGDVAKQLGHAHQSTSIDQVMGLSGSQLGIGLGIIRLASLASLPLIGLADRTGRRWMLLRALTIGLALTVAAAASPTYWWFVIIFACGRPLLSAVNGLTEVVAAEQTNSANRASAIALASAGYAAGAGLVAILHSLASSVLGFRGIFLLSLIPLLCVPALARRITEPDRFVVAEESPRPTPVLGAVGSRFRRRLSIICVVGFAVAFITGPANSFIFIYAQSIEHQPGWVTAIMVVGAGVAGLGGLLAGRWLADHVGRRPTALVSMVGLALCGVLAYTGSSAALIVGYILGVIAGAIFAPAIGALLTELFPTEVRASATGWWVAVGVLGAVAGLVAFGTIADVGNRFGIAGLATFLPAALFAGLLYLLPETMGREPEALWDAPVGR